MKPSKTPAPLVRLRRQLDQYRGVGKRAVFPDELKWQAVALLNDYSPMMVQQALHVSSSSLSRWKEQALTTDLNTNTAGERVIQDDVGTFVSLPVVDQKSDQYPLSVRLCCANGDEQIALHGNVTLQQWRDILTLVSQALLP